VERRFPEIDERAEVPIQKNLNFPTLRGFDIPSLFRLKNFTRMPKVRVWVNLHNIRDFRPTIRSSLRDALPPSSSGPSCTDWRLKAEICRDGGASVLSRA